MTLTITLCVLLALACAYIAFLHNGKIKDNDKDFIPDTVEEAAQKTIADVEARVKRVKEELADVGKAISEVGNQIGDVPAAIGGKKRAGRKGDK